MVQPVDYALGLLFAAWLDLAGWGLVIYGCAMFLGGLYAIGWLIVNWGGVTLGPDPVIPHVEQPTDTAIHPAVQAEPNYHRSDADTHVLPMIPGATPPKVPDEPPVAKVADEPLVADLSPQLAAVARYLGDADAVLDALAEPAQVIEGLRVIPSPDLGPVCPFCGGPWHANCPSAPKSAPTEETQVVDLCPLTTQDIEIPREGEAPFHDAMAAASNQSTQELSAAVRRAKERAA